MNKEYIKTIIDIYSENVYPENFNNFLSNKEKLNKKLLLLKKIFRNFTLFIYFIIVCIFAVNFLDNIVLNKKLEHLEGIFLFSSIISILFLFAINDLFSYLTKLFLNSKYKKIKLNFFNIEKNEAIKDLAKNIEMEDNYNIKSNIEYKLQDIQDNNHLILKDFYNSHNFLNKETKKYIYFLIKQSDIEEDFN